jgi:hypothetical protein
MDAPPPGYTDPIIVYLVETKETGECAQIGGFLSEEEANMLLERLLGEGRDAYINMVPIHRRVVDYEYDR